MKKVFFVLGSVILLFSSCMHSFKKSSGGLEYKIISDGIGKKLENGDFFEIWFNVEYKDSQKDTILQTTDKIGNQVGKFDSMSVPPQYYKIFSQLRDKDSFVVRISTDTIMKTGQAPPFFKHGEYIMCYYKIVNIFTTKTQADSAMKSQRAIIEARDSIAEAAQLIIDTTTISNYLAKNNISAVKTAKGTFVHIDTPGTGPLLDTGNVAVVNYTGKTFDGTMFDSNTDPKYGHVKPLSVKMWLGPKQGGTIEGWTDGLKLLSKGSKATLYIPSPLGYGSRGAGGRIKPNAILVFNVGVTDILTRDQEMAKEAADRAKMEAMHQHYMDSLAQARKDTMGIKK